MKIWTDGSCVNGIPDKPGGWAWHSSTGLSEYGGAHGTTNNRMEMVAILEALHMLRRYSVTDDTTIHSDSQYCVRGLNEWSKAWKKRGWTRQRQPIPNQDLWIALDEAKRGLNVRFVWVKGHNGDAGNEEADRLAELGRRTMAKQSHKVENKC